MTAYAGKIQIRRNTEANFTTNNPTLLAGEPAFNTDGDRIKLGDGTNNYANLKPSPFTIEALVRLNANYTLTSTTAAQKMFNASTNGALTLPIGSYRFNCLYLMTSMSATSGNSNFSFAGTAVLASLIMMTTGADAVSGVTTAHSGVGTFSSPNAFGTTSQHTAAVNTTQHSYVTGAFKVTTAGTIIPSVSLVTAAAAIMSRGSYFELWSTGQPTQVTVGNWS